MFCDLVGSTALAERLDPEDLRDVMRAYRSACAPAIDRYDGRIVQYLGDGVMAYFGYPEAHEDDAERAIRAALDVVEAVGALVTPERLLVRVGIATGPVVIETASPNHSDPLIAAVGETPNLAALMQSLAAPNTVIVTDTTQRLTGNVFEYEDLGPCSFKGLSEPVHVYRAVRERRLPTRFESLHREELPPLVGRESELALLLDRWQRAKHGDGQVVLVGGEAGIGKSRIVEALRGQFAAEPHFEMRHQCSSYHSNSALYPVIRWLEDAAGFTRYDSVIAKLEKLETLLAMVPHRVSEVAQLFAALLSIPTSGRYPTNPMSPQQQRQATLDAVVEHIFGLASKRPVLLVFEDVQWIDPSTHELLALCIDRLSGARVLMIFTHRPDFTPLWVGRGPVTALSLSRLSPRECETLIKPLVAGKALPKEVLSQIVARTEGVPLFVEELTKAIRESGLLVDTGDRYEVTAHVVPLTVPATLRDSLVARLDRLGASKEVAQIGAAIGREFPYTLLAAVAGSADRSLEDALIRLERTELVYRQGMPPDATYRFKHALVQEAAHASLLKSKRQRLHGRIAGVLEQEYSDLIQAGPEVLAHHYTEAEIFEKAVDYWLRAGHRAIERSANVEALSHFSRGLALIAKVPHTLERDQQELALQIGCGTAYIAVRGYAAPETGKAYTEARMLCSKLGGTRELFRVLFGLWGHHWVRAELGEADRLALEIESEARRQSDTVPMIVAHRVRGSTLFTLGEFASAREYLEQTIILSSGEDRQHLATLYAVEPRVAALLIRAWVLWLLGYPDAALRSAEEGRTSAQQLTHAYSLAFALYVVSAIHSMRGDAQAACAEAELCVNLADEHQIVQYATLSRVVRGCSLTQLGQTEAGLAEMQTSIERSRRTAVAFMRSWMLACLAEAYARSCEYEQARQVLDEALRHVENTGERLWEADLHRLRGELVLMLYPSRSDLAESSFQGAIEIARTQGAKSLELRATTSLARLWRSQHRMAEATCVLTPVYAWFTEGFGTSDLQDAQSVLASLS